MARRLWLLLGFLVTVSGLATDSFFPDTVQKPRPTPDGETCQRWLGDLTHGGKEYPKDYPIPSDEPAFADLPRDVVRSLLKREFQLEKLQILGSGGTSTVIQVPDVKGVSRVFIVPRITTELQKARDAYHLTVKIAQIIGENDEADLKRFMHIDASHLEGHVPWLEVEGAIGSLSQLYRREFSVASGFQNQAGALSQMADLVEVFHKNGLLIGDIKPDNFLVTDQRFDDYGTQIIFGGDLESTTRIGQPASRIHTPRYTPTSKNIHNRGAGEVFKNGQVDRDTYALMISQYETLVGSQLGLIFNRGQKGMQGDPPYVSAHSVNSKVPPALSMIAWTHFKSAEAGKQAIAVAQKDPTGFLKNYYGPEILEKMPPIEAARVIGSSAELLAPFEQDLATSTTAPQGIQTGLSTSQLKKISLEIHLLRSQKMVPPSLEAVKTLALAP